MFRNAEIVFHLLSIEFDCHLVTASWTDGLPHTSLRSSNHIAKRLPEKGISGQSIAPVHSSSGLLILLCVDDAPMLFVFEIAPSLVVVLMRGRA